FNTGESHESSNRTNRGVQGAVRGNGLEPSEKSARSAGGDWCADREVFREAEVCSTAALEVLPYPAEIGRHHAVDGLGLYPDVGLAIRSRICPALVGARNGPFACRQKIRTQSRCACIYSVHGRVHRA